MSNIKDLLAVNHNVYTALKNKNDIKANINGYEFIGYSHDTKSDHGGIAYYNPDNKSVIISNRGSATLKDWFVNNPKIAIEMLGKPIETMADVSAMRFTNNILEKLDRDNNQIDNVILSSHSKGGRESQKALIEVVDNLNIKASALTFNSAPCRNPSGNEYDHINLRLSGSNSKFYNSDLVSVLGNQLGRNYNVNSDKITNPIKAHSLNSFDLLDNKSFMDDDLKKIFDHVKSGKSYMQYENVSAQLEEEKGERSKTFYSLGGNQKESRILNNDAERGATVSLVDAYDKAVSGVTGKQVEVDGSVKSMAREALTFDKVDVAKIATWNTIEQVAGAGAVSTGVKAGILAHEIYKGNQIVGNEVNRKIEENFLSKDYKDESINQKLAELLNKQNHFDDDFIQKREIRFFQDQEEAVKFSKENFKDIQMLLELHARNSGYESTKEYISDSPYFTNIDDDKIERALQNRNDNDLNKVYEAMAIYSADSIVYDLNYFKESQQNIEENYPTAEMYIFLSDENSQSVVIKDNLFMDDEKSAMGAELDAKVFDKAEQVEEFLEANESMLQARISRINLVDMRSNPNITQIKAFAQGKLNHIKEEISELKTLHSATVTPLGEAHNNVIMVDTKGDNLYSISKNKLVGHDIDLDDILKNSKKKELSLYNNGEKVVVGKSDNDLHNASNNDKIKEKDKGSERDLGLDM